MEKDLGGKETALIHREQMWQGHAYVLPVSHIPGHVFAYLLPTAGQGLTWVTCVQGDGDTASPMSLPNKL